MIIFPAIDIFDKKVVRLYKGDYNQMTVYDNDAVKVALSFEQSGASHIHVVDLEGAKNGTTSNFEVVKNICKNTNLFLEIGGGIRDLERVKKYIDAGASRVIIGTSAVTDREFLRSAIKSFKDKIAVGADILDGFIAIKGWQEKSKITVDNFFTDMINEGVKNIICTDISKDGAMKGCNKELYIDLNKKYKIDITASGGVSSLQDIVSLRKIDMYGAIIGKAYYTGAVKIEDAIEVAK